MGFSRRNFLKAAGSGVALTTATGETLRAQPANSVSKSFTSEKGTFLINGKLATSEYEARTTLWEVISMKLGLTGTNRSCNRASCGACTVLVDGTPLYSCHTLATEAVGKKIFTIEGLRADAPGDGTGRDQARNLHPLQRIGHVRVAADCGFCTAGWLVTAKALLDKNPSPNEEQVKAALAGHICRCAAYPNIIRTVMDSAAVLRGERVKIEPELDSVIHIKMPMVRDYSTSGGHLPGDEVIEGASKTVTRKWQGYPPENLQVLGTPLPPLPEVSIPRFTGRAQYASRVWFPDLLYVRFLTSPHPHCYVKDVDTSAADHMPGVKHILTFKNAPVLQRANVARGRILPEPLPRELNLQGEVVAMVAAETEDLAQDACDAIKVDYDVLPFASTLNESMAANAPDLGHGKGNLIRHSFSPKDPTLTWADQRGDIAKGFAEADVIKEFRYRFAGGVSVPMQPSGSVAKWDKDRLTMWGMGQGIYPVRASLATALGMDVSKIRFINKWNGSTFGAARMAAERFYPMVAHLAKVTNRPVKVMLPKDQELAQLQIKPETITKFRVGLKKDGRIVAIDHDVFVSVGDLDFGVHADGPGNAANQLDLYTAQVPHWRSTWSAYRTNAPRPGPSRSHIQQETKWSWENMIDELADGFSIDPIEYRKMHMTQLGPGDTRHRYETMPTMEVLTEGARAFGWDQRNPVAGGAQGRFKRGFGMGMSQHHGGIMGYHEGEAAYAKLAASPDANIFTSDLDLTADGNVTMKIALPDSGSNAASALAALMAEMLGFTTRERIRLVWGDSDLAPLSDEWFGGRTITLQGAALCSAADKMRKDLLARAASILKTGKLTIKDGVISSPNGSVTFAALARANNGLIRHTGKGTTGGERTALNKGVGACFIEVEVDTWTGHWKFVRAVYTHDTGLVINPLVSEADMVGSLMESTQVATDPIPWDREFPGSRHYSVGYLSYRLPTIMDIPKSTQVYIDSLEPRWFYGIKSFSETTIGCVPGAISNAIYNACGVRIREHPITREKIMAGIVNKKAGRTA